MIRTVNGNIASSSVTAALCHEHICCYSEWLYAMSGTVYMDKKAIEKAAVQELVRLKNEYGLNLFMDCTAVNIGRDIELLKRVSEKSGVNIVCSTGFYYTEEPVLFRSSAETVAEHMIRDAKSINAGIIKAGVQYAQIGDFNRMLLAAAAITQKETGLPIVVHSNSGNKNGVCALDILTKNGACAENTVIGHLDGADKDYLLELVQRGCYVAFDQMWNTDEECIRQIVDKIEFLCQRGYENRILLSHDKIFFNGFQAIPDIRERPGYDYAFKYILSHFDEKRTERLIKENPVRMLTGR